MEIYKEVRQAIYENLFGNAQTNEEPLKMTELGEYTLPYVCPNCGSKGMELRVLFLAERNNMTTVKVRCYECEYKKTLTKNKNLDNRVGNPSLKWVREVKARDEYKCQDCGATEDLEAHHIKSWADYPDLRLDVNNGITLCHACHVKRHGYDYRKEIRK